MSEKQTMIEHQYIETNGIRLHVAQAGAQDAPLVILLHGFPEFWYGWHRQIAFLAEQGYRVWAPDQRGYNLSDKPDGVASYKIELLVQDVIGLIAAGEETVYLAGHDWGAAVAWGVALTAPERLKKLAILNVPHPKVFARTLRSTPGQMLKSWYILFFQLPWLPETLMTNRNARGATEMLKKSSLPTTFSDAELAEYQRAWLIPGAMRSMINWYRAIGRYQPDTSGEMRVRVPTLVLWGAKDVALTSEMARESVDLCDDGRLVMFEDATHWVQHDQPDEVNAHLRAFFQPDAPESK